MEISQEIAQKEKKKKKDSKKYIEKLEAYIVKAEEREAYSINRFDFLIISLSGGGLVLSIAFVKDVIKDFAKKDPTLLKISWTLFGLTLVLNLISQITGYYANKYDIKVTRNCIREAQGKELKGDMEHDETIHCRLDNATNVLNFICLFAFIAGVSIFMFYMYKNI